MYQLIAVLIGTVNLLIWVTLLLMFIRMILSFFPGFDGNILVDFIFGYTELVTMPVRTVMEKFNIMQDMPIDMAFTFTWFILIILQMFLS